MSPPTPTPTTETGIVEKVAPIIFEAMRWAAMHAENGSPPPWQNGNSTAEYEARKAARAAIAAMAGAWRPIETAPLSPAEVDLWVTYPGKEYGPERITDCRATLSNGKPKWHFRDDEYGWKEIHGKPTHWMPLPEPPAQFRAQEQRS